MAADSFEQALDAATNEVRTWPVWKRTLLGTATPEDKMVADQERNERIAKALGLRLSDEPMEWVDMVCVVQQRFTRCWVDSTGKIQACGEELPDFSLPEWQIKIQDFIEAKCHAHSMDFVLQIDGIGTKRYRILIPWCLDQILRDGMLDYGWEESEMKGDWHETRREAMEEALLWLAEREVKHD